MKMQAQFKLPTTAASPAERVARIDWDKGGRMT